MKRTLPIQVCLPLMILLLIVSGNLCGQKIDSTFTSPFPQRSSYVSEIIQQPDGKIILAGDIDFYDSRSVTRVLRLNPDGTHDRTLKASLPEGFFPARMELMSSGNILLYDASRIVKLGPNGGLKNVIQVNGISSVTPLPNDKFMVTTWSGGLYRYKGSCLIDSTFPNQDRFADGAITDLDIQGNKYVICGSFTTAGGVPKNDLARIFHNGAVDTTFDTGTGTNNWITGIEINPVDGMIYPLGYINSFDGIFFAGLVRLQGDGSIDSVFSPAIYTTTNNLFFTEDNKIIVSGFDGIIRVNNDGIIDYDFPRIYDGLGSLPSSQLLSDGSLLVASLKQIGGDYGIIKFGADGIQIPNFFPPVSRLGTITSMDRINKKLIVAGEFFVINKHRTNNVARLNANGSIDTNFKAVNNDGAAFQCTVLSDGKILLNSSNDFSRLNSNGELDPTFQFSPFKKLYQVENIRVLNDGKIIAAGPNGFYRLNSDGSEDTTFDEGTGFCCISSSAYGFGVQSSQKPIYGALLTQYNGTPINNLTRLNHDASVDPTFNIGTGPNNTVSKLLVLNNDDLLVGGWFNQFNGHAAPSGLVKLKSDGLLDTTFNATLPPFSPFFDLKEFGENILVSSHLGGEYAIAMMNANGGISTDFALPAEIDSINFRVAFYIRNNNTFYILGPLTITGQTRPSVITKINYTPTAAASTLARVASTTEIPDESPVNFKVYPNPSQREIIFDVTQSYDVRIVKYSGQLVMETTVTGAKNTIDISTLKPDTYVIQLIGKKKRQTSILVKN